ncbi:hypothetical protein PIB30_035834, partial [Stylosanthes scabra]|nr:hypothetical protein [Stylosanthes scabra]
MVIEAHELRYFRCQLLVIWRLEWTNGVENDEYMCLDARWRDGNHVYTLSLAS